MLFRSRVRNGVELRKSGEERGEESERREMTKNNNKNNKHKIKFTTWVACVAWVYACARVVELPRPGKGTLQSRPRLTSVCRSSPSGYIHPLPTSPFQQSAHFVSPALRRLSLGHEQRGCRISLCSFFSPYDRLSFTLVARHRSGRSTF